MRKTSARCARAVPETGCKSSRRSQTRLWGGPGMILLHCRAISSSHPYCLWLRNLHVTLSSTRCDMQGTGAASSDSDSGSDGSVKASARPKKTQAPAVPGLKLGGKPGSEAQSNGRGSGRRSSAAAAGGQLRLPASAPRYADNHHPQISTTGVGTHLQSAVMPVDEA